MRKGRLLVDKLLSEWERAVQFERGQRQRRFWFSGIIGGMAGFYLGVMVPDVPLALALGAGTGVLVGILSFVVFP
jgi:hypothetical protein